ncbi:hypothetical protein ASC64_14080 [Nocardioides sp. Root122]|uniref:hypothetical protein n=1 Tax=Nocardioides TaxID=1839 RepID=UPI0007033027|nr:MULTISPECIES: hypothetical protein [Nocardioides]KQV64849.1 hypothetical protein ASC64_14080 [Nocardioides sp. Root122]MCK9823717.1 hypothetical protein [Nocardioides cavernae]
MRGLSHRWRGRVGGGVVLAVLGYALALWLDFDPQPLPYAVWAVVVLTMTYLVIDTVDTPAAHWQHPVEPRPDRVDEVTSDLRILSSHQQADHPSDALAQRLVALARDRSPDLASEVQDELAGLSRIPPAAIDRILTRIEESRDRS